MRQFSRQKSEKIFIFSDILNIDHLKNLIFPETQQFSFQNADNLLQTIRICGTITVYFNFLRGYQK